MTRPLDERAFRYESCDIPAGMTIAQWHTSRAKDRAARPSVQRNARRRIAAGIALLRRPQLVGSRHGREARA
jgi:hypothetical protein